MAFDQSPDRKTEVLAGVALTSCVNVAWVLLSLGLVTYSSANRRGCTSMAGTSLPGLLGFLHVAMLFITQWVYVLPMAAVAWTVRTGVAVGILLGGVAWVPIAWLHTAMGMPIFK